jgi:hypothetical protein
VKFGINEKNTNNSEFIRKNSIRLFSSTIPHMEKQNENSQKGGLFLGILVGVAATLFVTTKKGRKMLHALSEEGLGKFGEWEKVLKDVADAIDDEDFVDGDDYIVKEERRSVDLHEEPIVRRVPDSPHHERKEMREEPQVVVNETPPIPQVHHVTHHVHETPEPVRQPETWPQPPQVHGDPISHAIPQPASSPDLAQIPEEHTEHPVARPKSPSRRFFRGIPRRG